MLTNHLSVHFTWLHEAAGTIAESITSTPPPTELVIDAASSFLLAFIVSLKAASRWRNRPPGVHATVDLFPVDGL